ncbi:MAG: beta-lactamase family protein [Planctomycetes bacterium]|nr:beta-lactamase family protein [Planctomycetota bacterium]
MKTLIAIGLFTFTLQAPAQKPHKDTAPVYDRDKLAARIDELARAAVEREGVPGITIAVAEDEQVFFAKGYGYANVEAQQPATADTRYPIGTLTRQFTAVAVLQLMDEEKLALEDRIEKYLPEFPVGERVITLQHMLSNTSGIPGFEQVKQGNASDAPATEKEFLAQFAGVPFAFEPGHDFSLDSANYALLSLIVARVAQVPYTQYVREHVLEPVGLGRAVFCPKSGAPIGFARDCLSAWDSFDFELPEEAASKVNTQSLCATAAELVKWQQAMFKRKVFSERASRKIMTPSTLADGNSTNFGYALQMTKFHDYKNYAYTGTGGGFRARLSYYSLPNVTVVVLANCESAPVERIEKDIARFIFAIPLPVTEEAKLTTEDAARCVGLYQIATTQYRIAERDGQLWFTPPVDPAVRLCHQGNLVFTFESDRDVRLTFNVTDGKVDSFTLWRGGYENRARRME